MADSNLCVGKKKNVYLAIFCIVDLPFYKNLSMLTNLTLLHVLLKVSSRNWQGFMNPKSKCFRIFPCFDLSIRFDSNYAFILNTCSNNYCISHWCGHPCSVSFTSSPSTLHHLTMARSQNLYPSLSLLSFSTHGFSW